MKDISLLNFQEQIALFDYLKEFVKNERLNRFEEVVRQRTRYATIVVEDIYQPHNISAVLRSSDCFGIQDVHIIENINKIQYSPDIELGASKWLTIQHYNSFENNTVQCLQTLKNKGYFILTTTPHTNNCTIDDIVVDKPIAIVFGAERDGITNQVREYTDEFVKIPMYGFTESFNISVSAALVMNSISNKIRKSNLNWRLSDEEQVELKINWLLTSVRASQLILEDYFEKQK